MDSNGNQSPSMSIDSHHSVKNSNDLLVLSHLLIIVPFYSMIRCLILAALVALAATQLLDSPFEFEGDKSQVRTPEPLPNHLIWALIVLLFSEEFNPQYSMKALLLAAFVTLMQCQGSMLGQTPTVRKPQAP